MGCMFAKKEFDAGVPRSSPTTYPRDPQYQHAHMTGGPAPVVNVPGSGAPLNSGEMFVAGAVMAGGYPGGMGLPGPEMYNPMSGGFQAL